MQFPHEVTISFLRKALTVLRCFKMNISAMKIIIAYNIYLHPRTLFELVKIATTLRLGRVQAGLNKKNGIGLPELLSIKNILLCGYSSRKGSKPIL